MTDVPGWIQAGCASINVAVVVTLVGFNYHYLKAAKRQAAVAEEQANAAHESLIAIKHTLLP